MNHNLEVSISQLVIRLPVLTISQTSSYKSLFQTAIEELKLPRLPTIKNKMANWVTDGKYFSDKTTRITANRDYMIWWMFNVQHLLAQNFIFAFYFNSAYSELQDLSTMSPLSEIMFNLFKLYARCMHSCPLSLRAFLRACLYVSFLRGCRRNQITNSPPLFV